MLSNRLHHTREGCSTANFCCRLLKLRERAWAPASPRGLRRGQAGLLTLLTAHTGVATAVVPPRKQKHTEMLRLAFRKNDIETHAPLGTLVEKQFQPSASHAVGDPMSSLLVNTPLEEGVFSPARCLLTPIPRPTLVACVSFFGVCCHASFTWCLLFRLPPRITRIVHVLRLVQNRSQVHTLAEEGRYPLSPWLRMIMCRRL